MDASTIDFTCNVELIQDTLIVRLPEDVSRKLPSRGQVMTELTVHDNTAKTVMEPDGRLGHWFKLDHFSNVRHGDQLEVGLTVTKDWPEPAVPADLRDALATAPHNVQDLWQTITPMARWEWVRWVNATANPATRNRRVEVSISKLHNGKRRPCCFNLSACTDPKLAKNAQLAI